MGKLNEAERLAVLLQGRIVPVELPWIKMILYMIHEATGNKGSCTKYNIIK